MEIVNKYKKQLALLRKKKALLSDYQFDKNAVSSNHFERLAKKGTLVDNLGASKETIKLSKK